MKILQISASYKPAYIYGGPTMSVSKLSEQLIAADADVLVLTTTANGANELDVEPKSIRMIDGVPVIYFKRITKDHSHLSPQLLIAMWQQCKRFDVVHIHAWWNTVSVLTCLIAQLRGVKVIVSPRGTLSGYSFQNKKAFVKKVIHTLLGNPLLSKSVIHVTSQHEQEHITKLINPQTLFNLPNFVHFPAIVPSQQNGASDVLKLIFLSRIEEKKGLDILIAALALIKNPYHLTIVGNGEPGYIDSLKKLADKQGVSSKITWAGFKGDNKFDILASSDLLVLPSRDENFGNVVIESLSVGTAVLVGPQVGLAGYISENKLGWVSNVEPAPLAKAIDNIDINQLAIIRQAAPQIIRRDFDEPALAEKYMEMYRQVLTSN